MLSRGDRIRTCDHLVPNQARYRAALHPEYVPLDLASAKIRFLLVICKFSKAYLIMPCSTNIFFRACTPRSTCSVVCVAISAKRTNVSCGAHAGGITGLMKTPASKANLVTKKVFFTSRTYNGMIGLYVSPISKPSSLKRLKAYFVTSHRRSIRSGSFLIICRASIAAAVAAGVFDALKM